MAGGAWWATVHRVTKSQTQLSDFTSLGGKVRKNLPTNAGDMGLIPVHKDSWTNCARVPQLPSLQLLRPLGAAAEAHVLESLCSARREGTAVGSRHTTARE